MNVKPVMRVSVTEQVYGQLKDELLSGAWKPGEKLPAEAELATLFSVSRVTIRQALQKLAISGLIETKLGEGSFAKDITLGIYMNSMIPIVKLKPHMLLEVLEFRQVVEVKTAGLCASRANEEDIQRLREIYLKMETFQNNVEEFASADLGFHVEIANITKNSLLIETHNIIRNILQVALVGIVEKWGPKDGLYYHNKLLSAIENGDSQEAMELMENHLRDTYNAIMKEGVR